MCRSHILSLPRESRNDKTYSASLSELVFTVFSLVLNQSSLGEQGQVKWEKLPYETQVKKPRQSMGRLLHSLAFEASPAHGAIVLKSPCLY